MRASMSSLALPIAAAALLACGRGELEPLGLADLGPTTARPDGASGPDASDGGPGTDVDGGGGGPDGGGDARLVGLTVAPQAATLAIGTRQSFTATALFSDGGRRDVTAEATWTANADAVRVDGGVVTALAAGGAVIHADFQGFGADARVVVSGAQIVQIEVTPPMATAPLGVRLSFRAEAVLSDGSRQDVTETVEWTSTDPRVATSEGAGQFLTLSPGFAGVLATLGELGGRAVIEVTAATLVSIQVEPVDPIVQIASTAQLRVIGLFSDMTVADVTGQATWTSQAPDVVRVSASGVVAALREGSAVVVAVVGNLRGSTTVTVSAATLVSLRIEPPSSTIAIMGTVSLRAIGVMSDGTEQDLTLSAAWSSADPSIADVSNGVGSAGVVTGLSAGRTTITAVFGGQRAQASVEVSAATLVSLIIQPDRASVAVGGTVTLRALGTFSDGRTRDVTGDVSWSSQSTAVASVVGGVVTGVSGGTATIVADLGGISARALVEVRATGLVRIEVRPANAMTTVGLRTSYTATAFFADGTSTDVTTQVTWTTGDSAIATISNVSGARGQLLARAAGTTTVVATFMGTTGSTNVTVAGAVLRSVTVSPIAARVPVGQMLQYQAVAIFSDGTQRNVTMQATWSSFNAMVAIISPQGQVNATAQGTTTISATFMGVTGSTTLTVVEAQLVSISISPALASVTVGGVQQFSAQGIYSDGTSRSVTMQATWSSSDQAVAQISTGRQRGRATGIGVGQATISATFQGVTGTASMTVTSAQIVSIQISPFAPMMVVGSQVQLAAVAIFSDGTSRDVTTQATWVSASPAVAQVSTGGRTGMRGLTTALSAGTANVTATFMGITGSTLVTVTNATVVQVQVTPFVPTVPLGFGLAMQATAILSDGTSRDVTALATWTSASPMVAAVSSSGNTRGQVTPVAVGTTEIRAQYLGVVGSAVLTVTNDQLVALEITPPMLAVAVMSTTPLVALGHFTNGAIIDLTEQVTWVSSAPMIADVSNVAGQRGQVTGIAPGAVTITATRNGVTGMAALAVQ